MATTPVVRAIAILTVLAVLAGRQSVVASASAHRRLGKSKKLGKSNKSRKSRSGSPGNHQSKKSKAAVASSKTPKSKSAKSKSAKSKKSKSGKKKDDDGILGVVAASFLFSSLSLRADDFVKLPNGIITNQIVLSCLHEASADDDDDGRGVGVCATEWFCYYADEAACDAVEGAYAAAGSCAAAGFGRFLEYRSVDDDDGGAGGGLDLQTCIRASKTATDPLADVGEDYCDESAAGALNEPSTICAPGMNDGGKYDDSWGQGRSLRTADGADEEEGGGNGGGGGSSSVAVVDRSRALAPAYRSNSNASCADLSFATPVAIPNANFDDEIVCMNVKRDDMRTLAPSRCERSPPSYGGEGQCKWFLEEDNKYPVCMIRKYFRELVIGVGGALISTLGNPAAVGVAFFTVFISTWWSELDETEDDLQVLYEYVFDYVNLAVDQLQQAAIQLERERFRDAMLQLDDRIRFNSTDTNDRRTTAGRIVDTCAGVRAALDIYDQANAIARMAVLDEVGPACITFHSDRLYKHEAIVGEPLHDEGLRNVYEANMDRAIAEWVKLATDVAEAAVKGRLDKIKESSSTWRGCGFLGLETKWHYRFEDHGCRGVGGPRNHRNGVVAEGLGCQSVQTLPPSEIEYYKNLTREGYTSEFLSTSVDMVHQWRLLNSTNVKRGNAGVRRIRIATSPIHGSLPSDSNQVRFAPSIDRGEWEAKNPNNRIWELSFDIGSDNYVKAFQYRYFLNGGWYVRELGRHPQSVFGGRRVTLNLEPDERITAVGAYGCNEALDSGANGCFNRGLVFKTSHVNGTGAFVRHGRYYDPTGGKENDVPVWVSAPMVALARNESFVPHVVAFGGWETTTSAITFPYYEMATHVPLWAYEQVEDE